MTYTGPGFQTKMFNDLVLKLTHHFPPKLNQILLCSNQNNVWQFHSFCLFKKSLLRGGLEPLHFQRLHPCSRFDSTLGHLLCVIPLLSPSLISCPKPYLVCQYRKKMFLKIKKQRVCCRTVLCVRHRRKRLWRTETARIRNKLINNFGKTPILI